MQLNIHTPLGSVSSDRVAQHATTKCLLLHIENLQEKFWLTS